MRIPIIRFGSDETPIAWWEWLFAPLVYAALLAMALPVAAVSIALAVLYPERHYNKLDRGTPREQELVRRYRRFASQVSVWRRAWRALTFYPYRQQSRRARYGSRGRRTRGIADA